MSTSKQPTLSKNNVTSIKVSKSNKKPHQNKQQQEEEPKQKSSKAVNVNSNVVCVSAPTTPQQRRTVLPVKARRVERRKEIVSMTEALKADLDTPSSTESDDSTSSSLDKTQTKKNNGQSIKQHNKKSIPTIINATTSTTILFAESAKKREHQQRNRRRSSSVIDVRNSHVYAGPTFNNAPAPSALPIPAFSPTLLSVDIITTTAGGNDDLKRHSKDLMNLLSPKPHHREFDSDLSEIQRGLRSMLKI
ncbi:hypothetical protein BD408DRAFT_434565 [Parasitella parasitica]|nr:hypothetical protein BD408DRAFT_434565 [Parasitella parasitica]